MRIAVAQLGARRHYAVPRILHEAGMLERLFTDSYIGNKPWLRAALRAVPRQLRGRPLERWLGRVNSVIPADKVTSFDWLGLSFAHRRGRVSTVSERSRIVVEVARAFNRRVVQSKFGDADTVWGFNGACLEVFAAAKEQGLRCIVEQTIAPLQVQNRLLQQEIERWPGWQPGLHAGVGIPEMEDRQAAEWQLADGIICGSQFVVDGIAACGGPVEKCWIVPYGVDLDTFPARRARQRAPGQRLRVLFAGEVGLRKGAPWLLEALRILGPEMVEARIAGGLVLSREKLQPFGEVAEFLGPVPRNRMTDLFAWADLFVLPSVCEGSAAVIYEAVASGLPVVCTPNTGALASEAISVVPVGDVHALVSAIAGHARGEQPKLNPAEMRELYGLEYYAKRLLGAVTALDHEVATRAQRA